MNKDTPMIRRRSALLGLATLPWATLSLATTPASGDRRMVMVVLRGGMDGLARDGDHIVAIQNLVGRGRVWRFRVDATTAHVDDLQLLLRQHPDLRNPTTGVVADRRFLFVADPNLQVFADDALSAAPAGRRGHRILALPLP